MFDPFSLGLGYGAWKFGKYIFDEFNKTPSERIKAVEIKELTAEPIYFAVAILAKFAKADGVVTKKEIATLEEILRDIELTGESRMKAISVFSQHKNGELSYEETLTAFAELTENSPDFRAGLCILLLRLAHADGPATDQAIHDVHQACEACGIDYAEVYQIFQEQECGRRDAVQADYEVLGCSPTDSLKSIKKRYRELTKTFHPDTISGKDIHPEITKLAAAKFGRFTKPTSASCLNAMRPKRDLAPHSSTAQLLSLAALTHRPQGDSKTLLGAFSTTSSCEVPIGCSCGEDLERWGYHTTPNQEPPPHEPAQ